MGDPEQINENQVIEAISTYLIRENYKIVQHRKTDQRGEDLIAKRSDATWYIEAKGATSSKRYTKRYRKPFNSNQINSHVSRAVYTAMKFLGQQLAGNRTRAALGLPDNPGHRCMVKPIQASLNRLGIAIFWVAGDLSVTLEDPCST